METPTRRAKSVPILLSAVLVLAATSACRAGETPALSEKPRVKAVGDGAYEISFAVESACDVTVSVVKPPAKDGEQAAVVRHLASGVLGPNAPEPFKKDSLAQTIQWDGKDDRGAAAADPEALQVRVCLGLKAMFDKLLGWDGLGMALGDKPVTGLVCGPDGTVYVLSRPWLVGTWLTALSRDGSYLRTLIPHPANLSPEAAKGYQYTDRPDGSRMPVFTTRAEPFAATFLAPKANVVNGQVMALLAGGKVACIAEADKKGPSRHLLVFGTDGAPATENLLGVKIDQPAMDKNDLPTYLAATPDGKTIFVSAGGKLLAVDWAGTGAAKPLGPDSLDGACGVAVDGEGLVYVADSKKGEIAVLKPDGTPLRSVPAPGCDSAIAVHPGSGNLYVMSQQKGVLAKLSPEGKEIATLATPCKWIQRGAVPAPNIFALDGVADPPVLWVANQDPEGRLWRVIDKGESFETEDMLKRVKFPWLLSGRPPTYMALDRVRDELYVKYQESVVRFDGATGAAEEVALKRPVVPGKWNGPNDITFGADGLLYVLSGGTPQYVWRFSHDGAPVPFPKAGECIDVRTSSHRGFFGGRGFDVAPDGDIYVEHYSRQRNSGNADPARSYPGGRFILVDRFAADGALKQQEIVMELTENAGGIRVDRAGHIYISINVREHGHKDTDVEALGPLYCADRGMLVKFPPGGGRVNFGRKDGPLGDPPADSALQQFVNVQARRFSPVDSKDHLWAWLGVSPCPSGDGCCCQSVRFDVDDFGRLFVPDALTHSVAVLDSQGNTILRFGAYGNPDSRGPGSAIPEPAIPFAYPAYAEASDSAVYVNDFLPRRIVRVRLGYAVEETAPLR